MAGSSWATSTPKSALAAGLTLTPHRHAAGISGALPPAYIVTAELDPPRDEAITYARRPLAAEVSVELHVLPKVGHVVDLFAPDAEVSRRSLRHQADAIARVLDQRSL